MWNCLWNTHYSSTGQGFTWNISYSIFFISFLSLLFRNLSIFIFFRVLNLDHLITKCSFILEGVYMWSVMGSTQNEFSTHYKIKAKYIFINKILDNRKCPCRLCKMYVGTLISFSGVLKNENETRLHVISLYLFFIILYCNTFVIAFAFFFFLWR